MGLWATIRSARKVALSWRRRERYCWIRDVKDFSIGVSDSFILFGTIRRHGVCV